MINIFKLSLSFLFLNIMTFAFADSEILGDQAYLMKKDKAIGISPILTPVKVIKELKNKTIIQIRGFRLENYPQMIVRDMKRGELYVETKDEESSNKSFKIIKKYEDDYGEVWHEVEGIFVIDSKKIAKKPKGLYLKAKKMYERTCSMCHHLPAPSSYTVNQWPQQIESMMEQVALDVPTKSFIIKYLQQNAADAN